MEQKDIERIIEMAWEENQLPEIKTIDVYPFLLFLPGRDKKAKWIRRDSISAKC